jgi:hypothetical protein
MTDISGTIFVPVIRNMVSVIKMAPGTSIIFNNLTRLVAREDFMNFITNWVIVSIDTEYRLDGQDSIPDNGREHLSSPFDTRPLRSFFLSKGDTK